MTSSPYHDHAALVGPLPTVRFHDGTLTPYAPPKDTCDPRYAACRDHSVACDCREAEQAEQLGEYRARLRGIERAAIDALRGHHTYAYTRDGEIDYEWLCMCGGCMIARQAHEVRTMADQEREGTSLYPCLRAENLPEEVQREHRVLRDYRDERARKLAEEECPF